MATPQRRGRAAREEFRRGGGESRDVVRAPDQPDHLAVGQHDAAFDDIAQFTDISGPIIGDQGGQRLFRVFNDRCLDRLQLLDRFIDLFGAVVGGGFGQEITGEVGADGDLTGYAGGLWRKRWLLAFESGQRELEFGPATPT